MKRFETQVGNDWRAWVADDKTTISKHSDVVTVVQNIPATETSEAQRIKMVFNLNVLPVYATVN